MIRRYFEFFEYLYNVTTRSPFDEGKLDQLLQIFTLPNATAEIADSFFSYLIKKDPNKYFLSYIMMSRRREFAIFSDENCRYIFLEYFSNEAKFEAVSTNSQAYKAFEKYMCRLNYMEKTMKFNKGEQLVEITNKEDSIAGLETLFKIAVCAIDAKVRERASSFINQLFFKRYQQQLISYPKVVQHFANVLLKIVPSKCTDPRIIRNSLELIRTYISAYERIGLRKERFQVNKNKYRAIPYATINVTMKRYSQMKGELKLKAQERMTILDLKKLVEHYMKLPKENFRFFSKKKRKLLDSSYDSSLIKDFSK